MVIDYNRCASFMCPSCGEMAFGDFSLFELSGGRGISLKCGCGKSQLDILPKNKEKIKCFCKIRQK